MTTNGTNGTHRTARQGGNGHQNGRELLRQARGANGTPGHALEQPVALLGARLIDGTGRDPIEDGALVMEGERILALGRRDEVRVPRGAAVIEADGMSILPGLIDCHVHLAGEWGSFANLTRSLMTSPSLRLLYSVPNARVTLEGGITTARDAGGTPAGVKQAIERAMMPGPRLLVAVTILSQTGGHGDFTLPCCLNMSEPHPADVPHGVVDGLEEMRKEVREILRAGADWIKLCTSGGVLSAGDSPRSPQFTVDEIAVAVYEAAAQGKRCMAHAQSTQGIKNALRAGVATIEHGIWLDDEAIQMMRDQGAYLVPTLKAPRDVLEFGEAHPGVVPDYAMEKARLVIEDHKVSFRRAVEAGVTVAMGTDSGVGPHGENAQELVLMVECGMTSMQSILASTRTAAEMLRLDDQVGTLAPGKFADVLVVDGDPLVDITAVADPARRALVLKGGAPVSGHVLSPAAVPALARH